ncbi:acyl-CoA N-acyltransferase [Leucogyrophana mollusca]|uniref:Acyl-CoA N-acyltransferase n=1 Tax=Leucogyrophana mollusca TaxID=85980 RepID=A0ACB8BC34_9AGAM|nr:acyl-CoA N-acyltransferase [Leucogyrophana mollusca]
MADPTHSPLSKSLGSGVHVVTKNGSDYNVHVLQRRSNGEVYVHYDGLDKRLDEWILGSKLRPGKVEEEINTNILLNAPGSSRKRKRSPSHPGSPASSPSPSALLLPDAQVDATSAVPLLPEDTPMTEEDFDIQHHKQITAQRNFEKVIFGQWQIKTWYFSPYPVTETELEETGSGTPSSAPHLAKIPGVSRATMRSHGRTSDLLAGGLTRSHLAGERSVLWVCDRCFKYMAEGATWELHTKKCDRRHPPGRKVYQRGAHTIWEVDGAKDKLYCQNLSLFGKLFIDVKTLFFDCDNFLFYLLTDAESQRDHEKISYDDYNLATIVVLPPYQRKGYGMLMIEFSYELSRRSGRIGTPERPLSDLGLRGYLTYWVSTLIRLFRRLLSVLPADLSQVTSVGRIPDISGLQLPPTEDDGVLRLRKKRPKGWDGEMPDSGSSGTPLDTLDDTISTLRTIETTSNPDGSATSHVVVRCTLTEIAHATNLRVDDAAFALNECGLLETRGEAEGVVVVTREKVEAVARERRVKNMCIKLGHVLL